MDLYSILRLLAERPGTRLTPDPGQVLVTNDEFAAFVFADGRVEVLYDARKGETTATKP